MEGLEHKLEGELKIQQECKRWEVFVLVVEYNLRETQMTSHCKMLLNYVNHNKHANELKMVRCAEVCSYNELVNQYNNMHERNDELIERK